MKKLSYLLMMLCASTLCASNNEILLSPCNNTKDWRFHSGKEFPGAKGGISRNKDHKMRINYDFTKGGKYVAIFFDKNLPESLSKLKLDIASSNTAALNYRLVDSTGQVFQGHSISIDSLNGKEVEFSSRGPWKTIWGGDKSKEPKYPFKQFQLVVANKDNGKGDIVIKNFTAVTDKPIEQKLIREDLSVNAAGWNIKGQWINGLDGPVLKFSAENTGGDNAQLSFTLPKMGRDRITRYKLKSAEKSRQYVYMPRFKDGGNKRNVYTITMNISLEDGTLNSFPLVLRGVESDTVNLGSPTESKNIKKLPFGVCTHFSFGLYPAYRDWFPYKKIMNEIAGTGYKWIRDGFRPLKNKDGKYEPREHDLKWLKYAHSKGLKTILCIRMYPDMPIDEYKKYVQCIVESTEGLCNVYELGNEPHNFGWKPKYKGNWNGKEKDSNETETWVKDHLIYTNALADHIKELRPSATVIGLGACTPTNFRSLDLGLSKSVDGVVDHPYTYSMPPEKVPFGEVHEKRDGIKVGDKNSTFKGMILSYMDKFKETEQMRSIWVTEFGFTSFWFNGKTEKRLYAGFTEEAQAVYMVRRFIESLALPIAVTCQYSIVDDYHSSEHTDEANFGLLRSDYSRKPAYYAVRRMNSLFNNYSHDKATTVTVERAPLHRSAIRKQLVADWDNVAISASNGVKAIPFANPDLENERMIAVWSVQPYNREFNNRVCSVRIKGLAEYSEKPIAIDIMTGKTYPVPMKIDGDDLLLANLSLKGNPIVIKFFK